MSNGETNKKLDSNMGKMETSISSLQGELDVANKPSKKHFKPGWMLTALLVAFVVGAATYLVAIRYIKVDSNTEAIIKSCEIRNEQIEVVNAKFNQLIKLFDAAAVDEPPPSEEVLKLYEEFRKPIPTQNCKEATALSVSDVRISEPTQIQMAKE